ncbi:ribokinase [Staphylococcus debuckii]|uniref:ribokinase n=1 Tax=Staphylococcus debuckii TaxID=2044912 RepID=UPI000F4356A9|nr:ribokinase [Staphylococcus debuckii]AYU54153.1 ribokinase [Staphylococcus debuckii]
MANKVVILGSTNVDQFLTVERYAKPGETLHVEKGQQSYGGGKGANQAIATARMNADTTFISKVGKDGLAEFMFADFKEAGMNINYILESETEDTGQAFITVDAEGSNTIYVYGGANMAITPEDVDKAASEIKHADYIVAQLEVPVPAIIQAFKIARAAGVTTILNPAPAETLPEELLGLIDVIIPNEFEAENLSGIPVTDEKSMAQNADYFLGLGIKVVVITLGEQGTYYAVEGDSGLVQAYTVQAVDTTAAGDTFIGAFVSRFDVDTMNLVETIDYANKAASLTVQKPGAQASIPLANEVDEI